MVQCAHCMGDRKGFRFGSYSEKICSETFAFSLFLKCRHLLFCFCVVCLVVLRRLLVICSLEMGFNLHQIGTVVRFI